MASIYDMPDEILLEVFKRLSFNDLINARTVCKRWRKISKDKSLYKHLRITSDRNLASLANCIAENSDVVSSAVVEYLRPNEVDLAAESFRKCANLVTLHFRKCELPIAVLSIFSHKATLRQCTVQIDLNQRLH